MEVIVIDREDLYLVVGFWAAITSSNTAAIAGNGEGVYGWLGSAMIFGVAAWYKAAKARKK